LICERCESNSAPAIASIVLCPVWIESWSDPPSAATSASSDSGPRSSSRDAVRSAFHSICGWLSVPPIVSRA
jgi:hypothetical protein